MAQGNSGRKTPDPQALPRRARLQRPHLRHHERSRPFRLVGPLHLDAALSLSPHPEGGRGLSIVQTSAWTIVMQIGTFLGYIGFGYLADRYNRKYTYISFLVVAALLVPVFAFLRTHALLIIGPLVGFFGTGYFSGFIVITSELFPISLRASAMGFVYNIGRIVSAAAPYFIGHISEHTGLGYALSSSSAAFLLAALIATALRPAQRAENAATWLRSTNVE